MLRDAYSFIVPLALLGSVCLLLGWQYSWGFYCAAVLFYLLALFVAFFFRDPERPIPTDDRLVVSPADGLIVAIKSAVSAEGEAGTLVSIFLSIFDVHINRSPIAGKIVCTDYRRGKFLVAAQEKASVENEMNVVTVENQHTRVVFKQIAGLIARRIVFWKKIDDRVQLGERVGLIKFGSRVDLFLPDNVTVAVKRGEHVKGGISIIGRVNS